VKDLYLVFFGMVMVLFFSTVCMAFDDGDIQYWNTETVSWNVSDDWKVFLEEEFYFGNDAGEFYYQHSDLGVAYSGLAPWLDVQLSYRHIFEEKEGKWEEENRPHFNVVLKRDFAGMQISNRSRWEYRDKENASGGWRYRNKLTLKLPWRFTRFNLRPYIA